MENTKALAKSYTILALVAYFVCSVIGGMSVMISWYPGIIFAGISVGFLGRELYTLIMELVDDLFE